MESRAHSILVAGRAPVNSGVHQKLVGVANALRRDGYEVSLVLSPHRGARGSRTLRRGIRKSQTDIVYVRQDYGLLPLLPLFALRRLRKRRNILDIPTPMSSHHLESRTGGLSLARRTAKLLTGRVMAPFLWWAFDVLLEYAQENSRWALIGNRKRMVKIGNGIDTDSRPLRTARAADHADPTVHLLGLGVTEPGYGLDRVLYALGKERSRGTPIPFRLLVTGGRTPGRARLESLVGSLGIGDVVEIRDVVHGDDLDELVAWADLGIGALALHRVGLREASPLKHREYLARGLPFFYAGTDVALRGTEYFAWQIPSNEDMVDLGALLAWARSVLGASTTTVDCRRHAETHMSFSSQVLPHLIGER